LFSAAAASAADNFSTTITSNGLTGEGSTANLDFSTVQSLINEFKTGQLSATLPTYTQTSIANAVINYRWLTATLAYPTTGTSLVFTIPKAGINVGFQGTTRDDS
jgi:hypothetical protein